MKNEDSVSYERYYVFKHIPYQEDSARYLTYDQEWSDDFSAELLFNSLESATTYAQLHKAQSSQPEYNFCIGEVVVSVNGFAPIIVV